MTQPAARLTVKRPPPGGADDQYPISVSLDGTRIGWLHPGEAVTVELAPGAHRLAAFNTLLRKTADFDAAAGEQVRYLADSRPGVGTSIFAALGAGLMYVVLEREEAPGQGL
ncbi:MAG: hypothetical protein U0X73_05570 [Thermoanaerobaculia bacterium]